MIANEATMVNVTDDCVIDILQLCNGVMNCDDCLDETPEVCYTFECTGSKYNSSFTHFATW